MAIGDKERAFLRELQAVLRKHDAIICSGDVMQADPLMTIGDIGDSAFSFVAITGTGVSNLLNNDKEPVSQFEID